MNGLAAMMYGQPGGQTGWYGTAPQDTSGGSTLGANLGLNVGSETFRVQLSIAGIFLVAVVVLVVLHANGHRASVHVS